MTKSDVHDANGVFADIEKLIKSKLGDEVSVVLYGSLTTGLATRQDFDLDITVVTP